MINFVLRNVYINVEDKFVTDLFMSLSFKEVEYLFDFLKIAKQMKFGKNRKFLNTIDIF